MGGGVLSKAASPEAASLAGNKAASSRANEDMWMKQLGRHGEEAAARERAEEGSRAQAEEEEKAVATDKAVR